jgi:hypothetical protein
MTCPPFEQRPFLTLPHLVRFANISSPRKGEAKERRRGFASPSQGEEMFAKRTR